MLFKCFLSAIWVAFLKCMLGALLGALFSVLLSPLLIPGFLQICINWSGWQTQFCPCSTTSTTTTTLRQTSNIKLTQPQPSTLSSNSTWLLAEQHRLRMRLRLKLAYWTGHVETEVEAQSTKLTSLYKNSKLYIKANLGDLSDFIFQWTC